MRRRTKLVLVAGGATAAITGGAIVRDRLGGTRSEALPPDEDAIFRVFAPGGKYAYWCNGPSGWVIAKVMPFLERNLYAAVAELLVLRPEDELLDIGCGPGAFLASQAGHVRRVVGLDVSPTMLREAERRLADRIEAGTATLVTANAAELPFGDGEFSAVTALNAPVRHAEAFRVLRPGGRLVFADPEPRRSSSAPTSDWGVARWSEADHRRMFEAAGFTDVTTRFVGIPPMGGELLVSGRKPAASSRPGRGVDGAEVG
jgi:SAM-dependent methyltransferase